RTFHLDQDLRLLAENAEFSQQDTLAYGESCEARGKADGKVEGKAEIAVNMLREGLSIDLVAKLTGFSEEEIKDISKK
ncbi:MAG: hypothetical protein PHQ75_12420, partial [Thermoguttaceae bacterium]|nr:hypothetical protein [Thermoguttaceae bacterium]